MVIGGHNCTDAGNHKAVMHTDLANVCDGKTRGFILPEDHFHFGVGVAVLRIFEKAYIREYRGVGYQVSVRVFRFENFFCGQLQDGGSYPPRGDRGALL